MWMIFASARASTFYLAGVDRFRLIADLVRLSDTIV